MLLVTFDRPCNDTSSAMFKCADTTLFPPVMNRRPMVVDPAIMKPAVYRPSSPRSQLCAMWQILSSLAPDRMRVEVSVARSIAQLLPISTSSPITTLPSWQILRGLPRASIA